MTKYVARTFADRHLLHVMLSFGPSVVLVSPRLLHYQKLWLGFGWCRECTGRVLGWFTEFRVGFICF